MKRYIRFKKYFEQTNKQKPSLIKGSICFSDISCNIRLKMTFAWEYFFEFLVQFFSFTKRIASSTSTSNPFLYAFVIIHKYCSNKFERDTLFTIILYFNTGLLIFEILNPFNAALKVKS